MKYAIVISGIVDNVILWDGDVTRWQPAEGTTAVQLPDDSPVGPGYTYDGSAFHAAGTAPGPVPETITPAQLYISLLRRHGIEPATLDEVVAGVIAQIPPDQATEANILWNRATEVRRDHPLIPVAGRALGLDSDAIDEVFRYGVTIV
jgi:hypothetical protein